MARHNDVTRLNSTATSQRRWLVTTTITLATAQPRHNDDGSLQLHMLVTTTMALTTAQPRHNDDGLLLAVNVWDKQCVSHPPVPLVVVDTSS